MKFSGERLKTLADTAVEAARAAGRIIEAHRHLEVQVSHKAAGASPASQVVTEVDHKAQAAILEILAPTCVEHDLALLTEESPDDGGRQSKPAFWCIDPMDGTLAFVNRVPGFSVSIALVGRDGTPLIGVVYDPVAHALYHAVCGQGARKNGRAMVVSRPDTGRPLVLRIDPSFRDHPKFASTRRGLGEIARELGLNGAEIHYRTGAVMNACGVLEDANACYFKFPRSGDSGGSLWDYAATACLFREAGAVAADIHGRPMDLNRPDSTYMNHRGILYAATAALAERIVTLNNSL